MLLLITLIVANNAHKLTLQKSPEVYVLDTLQLKL